MSEQGEKKGRNTPLSEKTRAFINKYRALGAPGFKHFRKRTKVETMGAQIAFLQQLLRQAAETTARANFILQELIKEENFAIHEDGVIEWVADDESLKKAEAYLNSFNGVKVSAPNLPQQPAQPTAPSDVSPS